MGPRSSARLSLCRHEIDAELPHFPMNPIIYQKENLARNYHSRHWPGPAAAARIQCRTLGESPAAKGFLQSPRAQHLSRPRLRFAPGCGDQVCDRLGNESIAGRYGTSRATKLFGCPLLPRFFPRRAGRCCMATATKTRSKKIRKTQVRVPFSADPIQDPESLQTSPSLTQVSREQEPLENAVRRQEAPEAWQTRRSEAPDAGSGKECSDYDTFTRGRSMS